MPEATMMPTDESMLDEPQETESFKTIDLLEKHGLSATDVKKLREAGKVTVGSILMSSKKELCAIKGLSEAKVEKIYEAANKAQSGGWVTGTEVAQKRSQVFRVATGSTALNDILGGGIESGSITEISGEFRCGKTQLCHQLCVMAQLPKEQFSGGNGKVAYLDTEGTFRPDRVKDIAVRYGLDPQQVLDNCCVGRAFTSDHQQHLILDLAKQMVDDQFSMIIIDSVTALFRVDYSGRGELAERQCKLGHMLSSLLKLAEDFNIAVFLSNQVMSDPSGGMTFVADPKKPVGGHVLAHACHTRLSVRKGRGEQRVMKIYDSPSMPEAEATFEIAKEGIIDCKD